MKRSRAKRGAGTEERAVDGGYRYTGPELSALLDQVRKELGAEASIVTADRIRKGGVAGFFAKEAFEVVAAAGTGPSPALDQPYADEHLTDQRAADGADAGTTETSLVATALLERADVISTQERQGSSRPSATATYDLRDRPPNPGGDADRTATGLWFSDVLDAKLEEGDSDRHGAVTQPTQADSIEECWSRLVAIDGIFAQRPVDASAIVVAGELDSAIEIADRLIGDNGEPYTELVVLTPATAIAEGGGTALRPESILHHHAEVRERLSKWTVHDLKGIVVVDAAFGEQLRIEVQRARNCGCSLVRLAYTDQEAARRLLGQLEYIGGHVVVDVVDRVDRRHVEHLVDCGIPVVSIGGRSVDPGMLFALANGVTDG